MNVPNLALRAMNEYRRVSPFTYLALRYTLLSSAAQQHLWAKEAAPEIMQRRDGPAYLPCRQYKTVKHGSRLEYRNLHFPCANEALAEAALLAHCADAGGPFAPKADVFSYHLTPPAAGAGSFEPYFKLSSKRQSAIAKACKQCPDDVVLYLSFGETPSGQGSMAARLQGGKCRGQVGEFGAAQIFFCKIF